jgi:hypothetical protein
MHEMLEPFAGILLIAAPWIFGFDNVGSAKTVSIVAGVAVLLNGMTTRWRLSLVKLIPLRTHFRIDLILGAALIVAPFVLGDSDNGAATRFLVIAGALEMLVALATNWDPAEEARYAPSPGGPRPTPAP